MDEEVLAGGWTRTKLRALTLEARHNVWRNARTLGTPEAVKLAEAIEGLGLPYSMEGGLRMDDPLSLRIYEVVWSEEGRDGCKAATEAGWPAIAGVDAILRSKLGVDYGPENQVTNRAGVIVGELMRHLGYVKDGERPMPSGSVAKTGATWR